MSDTCPYLRCRRNGAQTTTTEYPDRTEFRCECGWFNLTLKESAA